MKLIFALLCAILLGGCMTAPSQSEIDSIDYGPAPITYEKRITEYLNGALFDPYSAKVEIGTPFKIWMKNAPLAGGGLYGGWLVVADVNAKNRFGAYTGRELMGFLFRHGQIIQVLSDYQVRNLRTTYEPAPVGTLPDPAALKFDRGIDLSGS